MEKRGLFITLEGPEGGGKSTQREYIADFLTAAGIKVIKTREPGGTPLAERIRELLLTPSDELMHYKTELLLVFAARNQHIEMVIKPHLAQGHVVLCDRFVDSSYAYQHHGRQMPRNDIDQLVDFTLNGFKPDITFMFNIPLEVGFARASARGKLDRFEQEGREFFTRVRNGYADQATRDPERFVMIDGDQTIDHVQAQLRPTLQTIIDKVGPCSTPPIVSPALQEI